MKNINTRNILIGAGPSCIAFAREFKENTLIFEKGNDIGGLCRSFEIGGGVFDLGGHSFHTPYDDVFNTVNSLFDGGLFSQKRNAFVYFKNQLIPYPFQKFFNLINDEKIVDECQSGLDLVNSKHGNTDVSKNYEEFLINKFGSGIASHFMLPYNRKLWAKDLKNMSFEWGSQRVAEAKGFKNEEKFNTTGGGGERKALQPDSIISYSPTGGFQEIFNQLIKGVNCDVLLNKEVKKIIPQEKKVICKDGSESYYNFLVSSAPLPDLIRMTETVPKYLIDLTDELQYISLRVEFILIDKRLKTDIQRIYNSEPEIPFHKMAFNHNSSDYLRSKDKHAIMAEISISEEKEIDAKNISKNVIDLLIKLNIIKSREEVAWTSHQNIKYGYPVYTNDRLEIVGKIRSWLKDRDIYTIGRFGEWEYINSDKCIMKGANLARNLKEKYRING